MKPIVKVAMRYNTGLSAGTHDRKPQLPASWTATVQRDSLPEMIQSDGEPVKIEASGFTRSQALLAVERQLKNWGIAYVLEVQG